MEPPNGLTSPAENMFQNHSKLKIALNIGVTSLGDGGVRRIPHGTEEQFRLAPLVLPFNVLVASLRYAIVEVAPGRGTTRTDVR